MACAACSFAPRGVKREAKAWKEGVDDEKQQSLQGRNAPHKGHNVSLVLESWSLAMHAWVLHG